MILKQIHAADISSVQTSAPVYAHVCVCGGGGGGGGAHTHTCVCDSAAGVGGTEQQHSLSKHDQAWSPNADG